MCRPILFKGEMVRAVLDGRKSQTRRVIKPQPYESDSNPPRFKDTEPGDFFICPDILPTSDDLGKVVVECESLGVYHNMGVKAFVDKHCPYGKPGDQLYVRETFVYRPKHDKYYYRADHPNSDPYAHDGWKPSIHMPRKASRITLEVTDVRVERVQDISEADCVAEGLKLLQGGIRVEFAALWDRINFKRGFGWGKNVWVWVVEFKKIKDK